MLDKLPVPAELAIRKTYELLGEREAFELFQSENINHQQVKDALSEEVCDRYAMWIYKNVK